MTHRILLVALAAVGAVAGCCCPAAEPFPEVEEQIRQQLARPGPPSIVVAVARGDRILWEKGFGWADKENKVRHGVPREGV